MNMGVPQLICLALYGYNLGYVAANNGNPKRGEYSIVATSIGAVIGLSILYCGGFFG